MFFMNKIKKQKSIYNGYKKQIILWDKPQNFKEDLSLVNPNKENYKLYKEGTIEGVEIILFNTKYQTFKYIKNNIKKNGCKSNIVISSIDSQIKKYQQQDPIKKNKFKKEKERFEKYFLIHKSFSIVEIKTPKEFEELFKQKTENGDNKTYKQHFIPKMYIKKITKNQSKFIMYNKKKRQLKKNTTINDEAFYRKRIYDFEYNSLDKELEFLLEEMQKIKSLKLSPLLKKTLIPDTEMIKNKLYIMKSKNIPFTMKDSLEKFFSDNEEKFSNFIKPNNQKEWDILLTFLQYQKYRTPDKINILYKKFQKKYTNIKILKEIANNKKLLKILVYLDNIWPHIPDNNIKMGLMVNNITKYNNKLQNKNYKIIETDFIISGDKPIIECGEFSIFPLYYNLVLIYSDLPELNTHIKKMNTDDSLKLNKIIYDFQDKFIFHQNDLGEDFYRTIRRINYFDKIEFLTSIF